MVNKPLIRPYFWGVRWWEVGWPAMNIPIFFRCFLAEKNTSKRTKTCCVGLHYSMLHSPLCECCSVTPWAVVNGHQIPKKGLQKKNQDYPQEKLSHVSRRLHWTGTSNHLPKKWCNGSPWFYKTVTIIFLPKKVASWRGNSHIPYQKRFWVVDVPLPKVGFCGIC